MVFFTLCTLAVSFVICFQCNPTRAIWDREIEARCLSAAAITKINQGWGGSFSVVILLSSFTYMGPVITVIMDTICVLLPVLVFGKLQISWRTKLAVFILLGLGLV